MEHSSIQNQLKSGLWRAKNKYHSTPGIQDRHRERKKSFQELAHRQWGACLPSGRRLSQSCAWNNSIHCFHVPYRCQRTEGGAESSKLLDSETWLSENSVEESAPPKVCPASHPQPADYIRRGGRGGQKPLSHSRAQARPSDQAVCSFLRLVGSVSLSFHPLHSSPFSGCLGSRT